MTRRQLLKSLLTVGAGSISGALDIDRLLWVPGEKKIFIPSAAQISLYGIPYHQSNASAGQWLGFPRLTVGKEIISLIRILEESKKREPPWTVEIS